jgi:hypothetical protein
MQCAGLTGEHTRSRAVVLPWKGLCVVRPTGPRFSRDTQDVHRSLVPVVRASVGGGAEHRRPPGPHDRHVAAGFPPPTVRLVCAHPGTCELADTRPGRPRGPARRPSFAAPRGGQHLLPPPAGQVLPPPAGHVLPEAGADVGEARTVQPAAGLPLAWLRARAAALTGQDEIRPMEAAALARPGRSMTDAAVRALASRAIGRAREVPGKLAGWPDCPAMSPRGPDRSNCRAGCHSRCSPAGS